MIINSDTMRYTVIPRSVLKEVTMRRIGSAINAALVFIIISCSGNSKDIESKKELISQLKEEANKGCCTEYRAESIGREIKMLEWEVTLKKPFWQGRQYEKVMNGLSEIYDLNDYADFEPDNSTTYSNVLLINPTGTNPENVNKLKWNNEDSGNIGKIISRTLFLDPLVDEEDRKKWSTPEYDIEISKNSSGYIKIEFLTKK